MGRRRRRWKLLREVAELRSVVRLLSPYLREARGALAAAGAFTLVVLVVRLAQPWPLKWILDGLTGAAAQPLSPLAAGVAFLGLSAAGALLEYRQVMALVGLGNEVAYRFRADLFRHVLDQSLAFHERKAEGELLTRVVHDTTRLRKGLNHVLTRLLQTVLTFVGIVAVLLWVDAPLAAVTAGLGLLAPALVARGGRGIRKAARKNRRREGKLAALVAEELIAIREVQTFRHEGAESLGFQRINAKSLKQENKVRRLSSAMLMRVELVLALGIALILVLGTYRVGAGAMTAGELVLFVTYAGSLYQPFFRFSRQAARMGTTLAAAERLRRLMLREPDIVDAPDAVAVDRLEGRLELRRVGLKSRRGSRGSRRWALRDVDVCVEPGQRVAVVGLNGSGKSTLLRLVLRLADPTDGSVVLDGRDVRTCSRASLRSRMSVVFQGSVLFGLTVRENLTLVRPDASAADVDDALARTGAADVVARLPDGLDSVVRKRGGLLSVGERQRLALARALLADGDVWLLDEPTTGLDVAGTESAVRLLEEATRGRTTLWATHDPRVAMLLDRVLLLLEGRVAFFGDRQGFRAWVSGARTGLSRDVLSALAVVGS
ncbi:MAG TPA: ABC transporter ATP-binding protein [Longimicrobiales bacterium]|nr:ABC transporter ATP-binding protein [Longimicrobiales bacterium]